MNDLQQKQYDLLCSLMAKRGGSIVSENYVNIKTSIEVLCGCGYQYIIKPEALRRNNSCENCNPCSPYRARLKFESILTEKGGVFTGEIVNARTKLSITCANSHVFLMNITSANNGAWCPQCSRKAVGYKLHQNSLEKKTPKAFSDPKVFEQRTKTILNIINEKGGELMDDIKKVKNKRNKLEVICKNKHVFQINAESLLDGVWCMTCKELEGKCVSKNSAAKNFEDKVQNLGGRLVGTYVNAHKKVEVLCENNHTLFIQPHSFKKNTRLCGICSGIKESACQERLEEMVAYKGGKLLSKYKRGEKVKILCAEKHEWEANLSHILNGSQSWCPFCRSSKGEFRIAKFLESIDVEYEREVHLEDIPRKKYDFYFFYEGRPYYLEYDGDQHFVYSQHLHRTMENFNYKRDVDKLKSYCVLSSGARLIRIDYKNLHRVEECVAEALEQKKDFYVSDEEIYSWLLNAEIPISLLKEHCNMDNFLSLPDDFVRVEYN